MAGSPVKRSKIAALQTRVEELEEELRRANERLGLADEYTPIYQSAQGIPELEALLDVAIVNAIITHRGNVYNVLRALDYDVRTMSQEARVETIKELLARPNVGTLLTQAASNLDQIKDTVIAKQIARALQGEGSEALASANFLARVAGWMAPAKLQVSGSIQRTNVFAILHDPALKSALDLIDHEPGEALAIASGETIEQEA